MQWPLCHPRKEVANEDGLEDMRVCVCVCENRVVGIGVIGRCGFGLNSIVSIFAIAALVLH